ncbi:MAG: hypothetical protein V1809_04680 [Planctomycetota bacterium]
MDEWDIKRSGGACVSCQGAFAEGQEFYSALHDQGSAFRREDFCAACWEKWTERPFSFWKTRRPVSREEKKVIDNAALREIFCQLEGAEDLRKRQFRYLLGLLLVRRKAFRLRSMDRSGGAEVMVLLEMRSRSILRLERPPMSAGDIAGLTGEIDRLFGIQSGEEISASSPVGEGASPGETTPAG